MRRSLRFFSSCSSSSLIFIRISFLPFIEQEVVASDATQDHAIEPDFDLALGFADFNAAADPGDRHRVTAGVQGDVAFDIDDAFMKPVNLGNPNWKWFQVRTLDGEQLTGNGMDVFFVGAVDTIT